MPNDSGTVTIDGSLLENNKAGTGGALSERHGTLTVTNSSLINNTAKMGARLGSTAPTPFF